MRFLVVKPCSFSQISIRVLSRSGFLCNTLFISSCFNWLSIWPPVRSNRFAKVAAISGVSSGSLLSQIFWRTFSSGLGKSTFSRKRRSKALSRFQDTDNQVQTCHRGNSYSRFFGKNTPTQCNVSALRKKFRKKGSVLVKWGGLS